MVLNFKLSSNKKVLISTALAKGAYLVDKFILNCQNSPLYSISLCKLISEINAKEDTTDVKDFTCNHVTLSIGPV